MQNSLFGKRGVSAVVATVLIIMITVAAVGIVWAVVIPMIRDSLGGSAVCNDADVSIGTAQGYTCYDSVNNKISVQVKKGANNLSVSGVNFILTSAGSSYSKNYSYNFAQNEYHSFVFETSLDFIDTVSIAPVLGGGKVCGVVSTMASLPSCDLKEISVEENPYLLNSCTLIDKPGVYTLQNDVSSVGTCFTITANDVVLDGNGKILTFNTIPIMSQYGILISGVRNNITIKNFADITDVSDQYTEAGGIFADSDLSSSFIMDNTIHVFSTGSGGYESNGITFVGASNTNNIYSNTIVASGYGISFYSTSYGDTISDNGVDVTVGYGISFSSDSSSDVIHGNNIAAQGFGIYLTSSSGNGISNNIINAGGYSGISFSSSTNDFIFDNNVVVTSDSGITFSSASGDIISGNYIESGTYPAIVFYGASSNNVINGSNTINAGTSSCGDWSYYCSGIVYADTSTNDLIEGNTITSSGGGIVYIGDSLNNKIGGANSIAGVNTNQCGAYCAGIYYNAASTDDMIINNNLIEASFTNLGAIYYGGGGSNANVSNNIKINSPYSAGILSSGFDLTNFVISNNIIISGGRGIEFAGLISSLISENSISAYIEAVAFSTLTDSIITNNFIESTTAFGIFFMGGSDGNTIKNSEIHSEEESCANTDFPDAGPGCRAIVFSSTSTNDLIENNYLVSAGHGIYYSEPFTGNPFSGVENTFSFAGGYYNVSLNGAQYI